MGGYKVTGLAAATTSGDAVRYEQITSFYTSGGTDVALADGGTGASLVDPNADRIMFWDDSAGAVDWLTPGTGLTITTTSIAVTGMFTVANNLSEGTAATIRSNIGLGTMATQAASAVAITGGTMSAVTVTTGTNAQPTAVSSETGGTLTAASANKTVVLATAPTINNSVFAANDYVTVYNNTSGSLTITAGTISTMRLAGTATTGSRALPARGMATLFFPSASECVVGGTNVT